MKKELFISILLFFILMSCEKTSYKYLDEDGFIIFKKGDTLIYKGKTLKDTFVVTYIEKGFRSVDKKLYIEYQRITLTEISENCKSDIYDFCWGAIIQRDADKPTSVNFRNDFSKSIESNSMEIYKIGTTSINNVYSINYRNPTKVTPKNVKKVYYAYKYGVIAYELVSGDTLELGENYLR